MKKRLDIFLCDIGFVKTRSKAAQLIKGGYVFVEGEKVTKSGTLVEDSTQIEIKDSPFIYVGRGGVKLKAAIDNFGIDLKDKVCLDVGASTGGFSDCMLKEGAKKVYAVDVGNNQMDESLRVNEQIVLFENTDIREFKTDIKFDFVSVDVSFISLEHILPYIKELMKKGAKAVILIKPQFEVGPNIAKKGVVQDKRLINEVVKKIKNFSSNIGFDVLGIIKSPILGREGNAEYLMFVELDSLA